MDFKGILVGLVTFSSAFCLAYYLLQKKDLNRKSILKLVLICAGGHFVGGVVFYLYAVKNGGDSAFYFKYATTHFRGLGYHFVIFMLGYLRMWFLGDSMLGAFLFSATLGFLGSIFYLLTFKTILDRLSENQNFYTIDPAIIWQPALVLLCWPSYFFWSAGIGKDSLAFLSIGMFLYVLVNRRLTFGNIIILLCGVTLAFLVRPYLFMIAGAALFLYLLFNSQIRLGLKVLLVGVLLVLSSKILTVIAAQNEISSFSFSQITERAISNQTMTSNLGMTNIPIPTHNPYLLYLFLPYLMAANLFLPLFIFGKNALALISSFENLYLILLLFLFFKNRNIWQLIKVKIPAASFLMLYFLCGMAFLGLINTNLGLAMREKSMYVPAFLIVILLVYSYKRILVLNQSVSYK